MPQSPRHYSKNSSRRNPRPCNDAAQNWAIARRKLHQHFEQATADIGQLSGFLSHTDRREYRAYAEAYEDSCLSNQGELFGDVLPRSYKSVIAVLKTEDVPFCGAFRIAESTFVTARHCFFHKEHRSGRPIQSRQQDVTLSILAEPHLSFALLQKYHGSQFNAEYPRRFTDRDDYIFLTTESIAIDMPAIVERPPAVADAVFLLGYFRFHQANWVFGDPSTRGRREGWSNGMRWTKAPLCRIGPFTDPCISHFCQSAQGFSGSPMLARGHDSRVDYFGIHIGTMSSDRGACQVRTKSTAGNMGLRIDVSAYRASHRKGT